MTVLVVVAHWTTEMVWTHQSQWEWLMEDDQAHPSVGGYLDVGYLGGPRGPTILILQYVDPSLCL